MDHQDRGQEKQVMSDNSLGRPNAEEVLAPAEGPISNTPTLTPAPPAKAPSSRKRAASKSLEPSGRAGSAPPGSDDAGQPKGGIGETSEARGQDDKVRGQPFRSSLPAVKRPDKTSTQKRDRVREELPDDFDHLIHPDIQNWYKWLNKSMDDYARFPHREEAPIVVGDGEPVPECLCYVHKRGVPDDVRLKVELPPVAMYRKDVPYRDAAMWLIRYSPQELATNTKLLVDGNKPDEGVKNKKVELQLLYRANEWRKVNGYVQDGGPSGLKDPRLPRLLQLSNTQLFHGVIGDVYSGNRATMTAPCDRFLNTGPHPNTAYELREPKDVPEQLRGVFEDAGRHLPIFEEWGVRNGYFRWAEPGEKDFREVSQEKEFKEKESEKKEFEKGSEKKGLRKKGPEKKGSKRKGSEKKESEKKGSEKKGSDEHEIEEN